MDMQNVQTQATIASQASQAGSQSAQSSQDAGHSKSTFISTLSQLLGGAEGGAEAMEKNAGLIEGIVPLSVLLAIAPQASDEDVQQLMQSLLDALQSADSEQLAEMMSHPALGSWLTEVTQFLESNQAGTKTEAAHVLNTLDQLLMTRGIQTGEQEVLEKQSVLLQQLLSGLQQHMQAEQSAPGAQQLSANFKALLNELVVSIPNGTAGSVGLEDINRLTVRSEQITNGSSSLYANLFASSSSNSTNNGASDQGQSQQQHLQRLSFMQPIAQVVIMNDGQANGEANAAKSDASAQMTGTNEQDGEITLPVTNSANALKTSAATEVKVPAAIIRSEQFTAEMSKFIVKNMTITQTGGMSQAKITLMPEHLGQLDVKINVHNGLITASFIAESAAARDLLENQLPVLRAALQQQGLQVEKLVVSHQQAAGSGLFQEGREQQPSKHQSSGQHGRSFDQDLSFSLELEDSLEVQKSAYGNTFNASA
jgi:flagellar hook-length control protein FliK